MFAKRGACLRTDELWERYGAGDRSMRIVPSHTRSEVYVMGMKGSSLALTKSTRSEQSCTIICCTEVGGSRGLGKDVTERKAQCVRLRGSCWQLSYRQRAVRSFSGLPKKVKQIKDFHCSVSHRGPSCSTGYQFPTSDHYQPLCQFPLMTCPQLLGHRSSSFTPPR